MKQTQFLLKVLLISLGLAILIKYGASNLSIPATPINALTLVFVPPIVMAIALCTRYTLVSTEGQRKDEV